MKILVNRCYGGFSFSDAFTEHIQSLTKGQLVNNNELWTRHNPFLVEEAIKFGLKEASGMCANLNVDEIPDGARYEIGEYDGQEWIAQVWIEATLDELRNGLSEEQLRLVYLGCDVKLKSY